jgi:hypothetical protein
MAKGLTAPSEAMADIDELDLFFDTWKKALGPPPTALANGTEHWLHGFGTQTKWLTGESWTWWIETYQPPQTIDLPRAQNFISLVIGMLGNRTDPQGEAVRYARRVVTYLESEANDSS